MLITPVENIIKEFLLKKYNYCPGDLFSFAPKNIAADYSSNLPLLLSRKIQTTPEIIFNELTEHIKEHEMIEKMELSRGFLNIKFRIEYILEKLTDTRFSIKNCVLEKIDDNYIIEFVSANPTGPLHIGHGRGAVIGNSLANLMKVFGASVIKEYYVNDQGNQIEILKRSVEEKIKELKGEPFEINENFYKGDYIEELAKKVMIEKITDLKKYLVENILGKIISDLKDLNIEFDILKKETTLYKNGDVDKILKILNEKKMIKNIENAKFLEAGDICDEKDRVLIKSDGSPTYFLSDIAYHYEKNERGFTKMINVWGADHHGYVRRLKGAIKLTGIDETKINIILFQMVNLIRNGIRVQMSKRSGGYITLKSLIDEVGKDVVIYFFLSKSPDSQIDFDMDLAKKQSSDNPVYYTQYCYARICSILRELDKRNLKINEAFKIKPELLNDEEINIIKFILRYFDYLNIARKNLSCHYLIEYIYRLSELFHRYYNSNRIITEDEILTQTRCYISICVKNILGHAFDIIGISKIEKM